MAYCRWSCDNYKSDVYVYEIEHGRVAIHVAGARYVGQPPGVDWACGDQAQWYAQIEAQREWLANAERVPIGGPFDRANFTAESPFMALVLLQCIQNAGYHVPEHAFHTLVDDAREAMQRITGRDSVTADDVKAAVYTGCWQGECHE